jgi:segregation and condensation protein A
MSYRVELDLFSGPLDLLLYLVRRNEVDLRDLPIAAITRQFGEFLALLELLDLELVGDFVVMASTLVEIKSRSVLPDSEEPQAEAPAETAEDPRGGLIQRLLEYKRFKEAATSLEARADAWQERYPRLSDDRPTAARDPAEDRIKSVELWDLVSALGRILERKQVEQHASIRDDETPIHVYVEELAALVRLRGEVRFHELFEAETVRSRIVGLFLALLELIRHHGFRAEQPQPFGEILIRPPADEIREMPSAFLAEGADGAADRGAAVSASAGVPATTAVPAPSGQGAARVSPSG